MSLIDRQIDVLRVPPIVGLLADPRFVTRNLRRHPSRRARVNLAEHLHHLLTRMPSSPRHPMLPIPVLRFRTPKAKARVLLHRQRMASEPG